MQGIGVDALLPEDDDRQNDAEQNDAEPLNFGFDARLWGMD